MRAADLDQMLALCAASSDWTYSVAWIDCLARGKTLGRGLVYRGEHATLGELAALPDRGAPLVAPEHKARRMPADLPGWALNRLSVSAFNALYYRRGKPGLSFPDYETFFYPLDAILECDGFTHFGKELRRDSQAYSEHAIWSEAGICSKQTLEAAHDQCATAE